MNKLSAQEKKILELFAENAKLLSSNVAAHMPKKTTIKWHVDEQLKIEGITEEIIEKGLVVSVRQFIDEGETIEFKRVVNILSRYHKDDEKKVARLRSYKRGLKKVFGPNPLFGLGPAEQPLTNREVFDMIAYSNHIHTDIQNEERYKKYESLSQSWIAPMLHVQLDAMILAVTKLSNMLRIEFIDPLLKK